MKKRMTALVTALLMMLALVGGCASQPVDITVSDGPADKDYPLVLGSLQFDKQPERVVVLSPSLADVALNMKMEACLVGKTEECTQEDLQVLPNVGGVAGLDLEAIKALTPELVLADSPLSEDQTKTLNDAGIKVLVLQPAANREQLEKLYIQLGSVLRGGKTGYEKAQKSVGNLFEILDTIQREIPQSDILVTACYLYDMDGSAVTGDQLANSLLEYAGAVNIAASSTEGKIEENALRLGNPTYIFCKPGVKEQLENSEEYKNLSAVQNGNVYEMEPSLVQWQGRSMWDAVSFMAGKMYPELVTTMEEPSSKPSSEPPASSEPSSESPASSEPSSSAPEESSSPVSSEPPAPSSSESSSVENGNPFPAGTVLRYGDSGDAIVTLQNRMRELGFYYKDPPSGTYDDDTKRGIEDFKWRLKILNQQKSIDSETVDDETLNRLFASDAPVRE